MYSLLCSLSSFQSHYINVEDFVFESAQDIFATMWGYLAALSNLFPVLQIKKLVCKKHVTAYENLM